MENKQNIESERNQKMFVWATQGWDGLGLVLRLPLKGLISDTESQ